MAQPKPDSAEAEANVYTSVYRVLLGGMLVSTTLFAIGLVRALLHPTYFPLTSEWIQQHYHWSVVWRGLATLDPVVLMMVATVLLILTPVARVLVSIYAFYVDRDRKYVAVTSIVFLVMVLTVVASYLGLT
jgi:uncharacterized membrane protein